MKHSTWLMLILCTVPQVSYGIKAMDEGEIKDLMISGAISAYSQPCPCPYSKDKNNHLCGNNSEYMKSDGDIPCYRTDITPQEVEIYREQNGIPAPGTPWELNRQF